jgi:hypothetical protein
MKTFENRIDDLRKICLHYADQSERIAKTRQLRAAVQDFCNHVDSEKTRRFATVLVDVLIRHELAGGDMFPIGTIREIVADLLDEL